MWLTNDLLNLLYLGAKYESLCIPEVPGGNCCSLVVCNCFDCESALLYCALFGVPCFMMPWAELSFFTCAAGGGNC
jgi:hypothetical protein